MSLILLVGTVATSAAFVPSGTSEVEVIWQGAQL
jgi:hypothetical protein